METTITADTAAIPHAQRIGNDSSMRGISLATLVTVSIFPAESFGVTWEIEPRISAVVSYLDNAFLTAGDKQDDIVYQANPALSVAREGPHLTVELDYGAQILRYAENSEADSTFQQGNASLNWTTKTEVFSISAAAARGQQAANFDSALPPTLETITDNRTTATSYSVTPRLQYSFGGTAVFALETTHSWAEYDGGSVVDEKAEDRRSTASLRSGPNFRRADWALSYSREEFNIDDSSREDYTSQSRFTLGYQLSSKLRWFGSVGAEKIVTGGEEIFDSDDTWDTGFELKPTSRTGLRASTGERAFGNSQSLSVTWGGRHASLEAAYSENVTSQAQQLARSFTVRRPDGSFEDITAVGTVDDIFLQRRFNFQWTIKGRRNTISLTGFDEQREFLNASVEESYQGVNVRWGHELGRRANLSLGSSYSQREISDTGLKQKFYGISASFDKRITRNVEMAATYDYNKQDSGAGSDFYQNVVRLSLAARF